MEKKLKCFFINVRGLNAKIRLNLIQDEANRYDVIGFAETLSNCFPSKEFESFDIFFGDDHKILKGYHGLALLVRKDIPHFFETDLGLWVRIPTSEAPLLVGLYYMPCENSRNWNKDTFASLLEDIGRIKTEDSEMVVMGDFNARTGTMQDYIDIDGEDRQPSERTNKDSKVNTNGRALIDVCKTTDMMILNGRSGKDRGVGNFTCNNYNGKSVVDYIIADNSLIDKLLNFEIKQFDPSLSDVHCGLKVEVLRAIEVEVNKNNECIGGTRKFWNDVLKASFLRSLENQDLSNICKLLRNKNATLSEINEIDRELRRILVESAEISNVLRTPRRLPRKNQWFDMECHVKRTQYRSMCRNSRSITQKKAALRSYKNFILLKKKTFLKNFNKKLLRLRSKNSKEYWSVIGSLKCKSSLPKLDVKSLSEHFQHLHLLPSSFCIDDVESTEGDINVELNKNFSCEEVRESLQILKCGKSAGQDNIYPEFLKYVPGNLVEVLNSFFNLVLKTGIVPDDWALSTICPIHKKGPMTDPNNYRGISLINCIGKVFSSIISTRIKHYLDLTNRIGSEQAGFRKGHGCEDHTFALTKILSSYLANGKRVYATFLDYEKAFDLVDRAILWKKLQDHNINGNVFNVIRSLYSKTKACVKVGNCYSSFFKCEVGVRQGDNLSPLLFTIFVNDFKSYLQNHCNGLTFLSNSMKSHLDVDEEKIFALLYADDTIILTESENDMQKALNAACQYCSNFNIRINCSKTKYMIFSRGKVRKSTVMFINNSPIERVDSFCYLGVIFKYNNTFQLTIKNNVDKAKKALFKLRAETSGHELAIQTKLHLFDLIVLPILTYGCEVWGHEPYEQIESFHRNFLRTLLNVRNSTPNAMIYGELGRNEIKYKIWLRILGFWKRLSDDKNKLSCLMYKHLRKIFPSDKWLSCVQTILIECGIPGAYHFIENVNEAHFKDYTKNKLQDVSIQQWNTSVKNHSLCRLYASYKYKYRIEPYVFTLRTKDRIELSRFRCAALIITDVREKFTGVKEAHCPLCNNQVNADEYHFLLVCTELKDLRAKYLSKCYQHNPSLLKLDQLMNLTSTVRLTHLSMYCKLVTDRVRCKIDNLSFVHPSG